MLTSSGGQQLLGLTKFEPYRLVALTCKDNFQDVEPKKVGIVAKYKKLCRDYWYVLLPVHVATSAVWFGSFYILCKSGVDVTSLLSRLEKNIIFPSIYPMKTSKVEPLKQLFENVPL